MEDGFLMTPYSALLYYRTCKIFRIQGRQERLQLLGKLAKRGKAKYLRDIKDIMAGKKVLRVKTQGEQNEVH